MDKKQIMLIGPDAVKAVSYVNFNVDEWLVGSSIREAQEVHLISIIGSNLLDKLQELVYNDITGNTESGINADEYAIYKVLLDSYVEPYLANMTQALLCVPASFKLRNLGVVRTADTNADSPSLKDVMAVQTRYKALASRYATYLSKFLCAHRAELPELDEGDCGCGLFVKPAIGKTFVETGLVLGSTDNGCDCR